MIKVGKCYSNLFGMIGGIKWRVSYKIPKCRLSPPSIKSELQRLVSQLSKTGNKYGNIDIIKSDDRNYG